MKIDDLERIVDAGSGPPWGEKTLDGIAAIFSHAKALIAVARAARNYNKQHTGTCRSPLGGVPCSCGVDALIKALRLLEAIDG